MITKFFLPYCTRFKIEMCAMESGGVGEMSLITQCVYYSISNWRSPPLVCLFLPAASGPCGNYSSLTGTWVSCSYFLLHPVEPVLSSMCSQLSSTPLFYQPAGSKLEMQLGKSRPWTPNAPHDVSMTSAGPKPWTGFEE